MINNLQFTIKKGGLITTVETGSLAHQLGVCPGDELLAVNGHPLQDIIDVQFYAAEDQVELHLRRGQIEFAVSGERSYDQALGLEFSRPTFDIDIRRCNNLCPFCFVLQMPPKMRRSLYVKDDDYRYSFLFGHYVTLTNLSSHDWQRIEQQHLSPLYVSVHATPLQARRKALGNPTASSVMKQLRWLARRGIQTHTQIVVTPGLNDGKVLERSVLDLARLYPGVQSVSIVPVGITRYHKHGQRPNTPAQMKAVLKAVHAWQKQFKPNLGARFVYATDEWYLALGRRVPGRAYYDGLQLQENGLGLTRHFLDDFKLQTPALAASASAGASVANLKFPFSQSKIRNLKSGILNLESEITLVTGALFAPTLRKVADELSALTGAKIEVIPIANHHFGETVTVAGLLTAQDVIEQLQNRPLGQRLVLPRIMFDHPTGVSLDGLSPQDIERALGRPVMLAETMRDIVSV